MRATTLLSYTNETVTFLRPTLLLKKTFLSIPNNIPHIFLERSVKNLKYSWRVRQKHEQVKNFLCLVAYIHDQLCLASSTALSAR